jgi:hypothetical protein
MENAAPAMEEMAASWAPLVEEWKPLLDGTDKAPLAPNMPEVKGWWERAVMARLLQNAKENINRMEAVADTTVFGTAYLPAVLGLIRGIFPRLQALNLCAVQPLDRPTGRVFYMDTKRGDGTYGGLRGNPLVDTRSIEQLGTQWESYRDWANGAENTNITADVTLEVTSQDVGVSSKKLKYAYTPELQQDLAAYHGIDAQSVLQDEAMNELAREIDAQVIRTIRSNIGAGTITYGSKVPASGYQFREWKAEIFRAILNASANIQRYRGLPANWIICGTDALVELRAAQLIDHNNMPVIADNGGAVNVGTLNGLMQVTHVPYLPKNEIILGRKGSGFADAGLIYLPYVLLFMGERVFDPNFQKWTRSFMSRFGLFVADPRAFARVVVDPTTSGIS